VDGNINGSYTDDLYKTFYTSALQTISLTATYGNCAVLVSKNIVVNPKPQVFDFVAAIQGACVAPVTINFSDTSSDAVAWNWKLRQFGTTFSNSKNSTYTFTSGGAEEISLDITNKEGCSSRTYRYVYYDKPYVGIYDKSYNQLNESCAGVTYTFATWQDSIIQDFKWDFWGWRNFYREGAKP
jgi:hypothetical protein